MPATRRAHRRFPPQDPGLGSRRAETAAPERWLSNRIFDAWQRSKGTIVTATWPPQRRTWVSCWNQGVVERVHRTPRQCGGGTRLLSGRKAAAHEWRSIYETVRSTCPTGSSCRPDPSRSHPNHHRNHSSRAHDAPGSTPCSRAAGCNSPAAPEHGFRCDWEARPDRRACGS